MIKIITKTPQELEYLGERMAQLVEPGDFIALDGDLGAGKTLLTQGLARGLAVTEEIVSPTFTIIHEYESGRLPLYHMDVYRLKQPEEMYDLGYEEYFYGEGVTVVEWAQIIEPLLPDEYLGMEISVVPEGRELRFAPHGARYERLIEELTGCDYSKYR
ncbi:MAG: tRNA (adenosine(37)-N6)-threonylcarbamoyltransferase complex ATPase subunit type 1 TsaE [Peptococcaceae bacterium]|nr:tRNA (adenosine(37)-N6)-threonylcarbamoyltransferase complex ATPase subunit type 1 TsaE [Peptococcaceae bacterium]